ncbi:Arginine-glutamic acid dipeptide repeat protein [Quillaja saponaria]|uniref:Arginine-glutamic acid dipeptide repeat protein n=1 Tax=Quillaja saponaria TaxID=32244 RepID=A0AAD7VEQ6_QUISA|nr:Arginine-glutamic acid dipeptide repeat protein [Quillaja saponaria]
MYDIFGEPQALPHVGDEYQAEIPSLVVAIDLSQLIKPTQSEVMINLPKSLFLGLPIPLMPAYSKVENNVEIVEFVNSEESQVSSKSKSEELKVNCALGDRKNRISLSNIQSTFRSDAMELKAKLDLAQKDCLLPDLLGASWKDIECNSFLLGLYIFGKNLNLVKRFVESKQMGDILSFYYCKFYRSEGYRRWSDCRKLRRRRCIYGQKIFTEWRQQELLSRLFSHVSEECQNVLVELCRSLGEGKMSFEEYVFTLKNVVGINMLIDAVGIGKGKQDLTGIAMEPMKTIHVFSVRPEIPIGKACSSLTSADIIKFLTGDFRLSKARSRDIFWEAVWPRLLARGWHSELPKDHGFSGSKLSLVFLIPGVKKFSRRRLVKGNHYFDSVSDVLNKVASDPGLLEIEIEATEGRIDKKERREPKLRQDLDGLSNERQYHYLQARTSTCTKDQVKFTIVDTSIVHGTKGPKVRQLRSFPFQSMSISAPSSDSSGTELYTSGESEDEAEQTHTSDPVDEMSDKVTCNSLNLTSIPNLENHKHNTDQLNDKHPRNSVKYHFNQKARPHCSKYLAPAMKKKKLIACDHGELTLSTESISTERKSNVDKSLFPSYLPNGGEGILSVTVEYLSYPISLPKGCPNGSNEGSFPQNCLGGEVSAQESKSRPLIDLNLPHDSPELVTDMEKPFTALVNNGNQQSNKSALLSEISQHHELWQLPDGQSSTEQQSINFSRRQSTRNRPLTTKALEALEYGFLNSKRKREC